ncbi:MAG: hypothetical protein KC553_07160 [Nitrospina sp.]|nr:hypothetical protein [Nitrospina sp.]
MMTDELVKKISAVFGTFAFTVLSAGSWVMGARPLSALVRGIEGFVVFGILAWCVCRFLQDRIDFSQTNDMDEDGAKGSHLDETV